MSETPSFYAAIQVAKGGTVSGIVTAPFHKEALAAGQLSPGHTEILAEQAGGVNVAMMLANEDSLLEGTDDEIVRSAVDLASQPGLHALDLLAYRFAGDVHSLMRKVRAAVTGKRVIVTGSIDREERIRAVVSAGADGFRGGTAAFDGVFPTFRDLTGQIAYVRMMLS